MLKVWDMPKVGLVKSLRVGLLEGQDCLTCKLSSREFHNLLRTSKVKITKVFPKTCGIEAEGVVLGKGGGRFWTNSLLLNWRDLKVGNILTASLIPFPTPSKVEYYASYPIWGEVYQEFETGIFHIQLNIPTSLGQQEDFSLPANCSLIYVSQIRMGETVLEFKTRLFKEA